MFHSPHTLQEVWWLHTITDLVLLIFLKFYLFQERGVSHCVSNFYFPNDTDYIFISFHCGSNLYFPNDIKIFFMCLLAISIPFFFLVKCLFKSFLA